MSRLWLALAIVLFVAGGASVIAGGLVAASKMPADDRAQGGWEDARVACAKDPQCSVHDWEVIHPEPKPVAAGPAAIGLFGAVLFVLPGVGALVHHAERGESR